MNKIKWLKSHQGLWQVVINALTYLKFDGIITTHEFDTIVNKLQKCINKRTEGGN